MGNCRVALSIVLVAVSVIAYGQFGSRYTYEFLSLPTSARETALGGTLITVIDDDVHLAAANPALLSDQSRRSLTFNQNVHFADISNGYMGYGFGLDKLGIDAHAGVRYARYGDFVLADPLGNRQGTFTANETAIAIGASRALNERIRVGVNTKAIFSTLETYQSFGLAADLGLHYSTGGGLTQVAFVIKNLGGELSTYQDTRHGAPLDIQIAFSRKLKHLPFRFTVTAHQLQQWDIRYDDPDAAQQTDLFGQNEEQSVLSQEIDNLFRHLIFSGEFLLGRSQNLRLRAGYNHFRRRELSVSSFRSLAGFSLGFGLKISKFRIDYGLGYHHLAGAANHLTISTNLHRFTKQTP